ncbi:MAG: hypothetical protein A3G59_02570 [Candidatus Taylorbacteria bacterium RIFCSPLOWO2_12_FULL_47_20]|uniref:IS630 family transposase n=1 Tax=Candidatus Taylorbacteria bacterium RIFCSPLOWO2_12_FULL_47_20 TaxID=1802335 RepID=A0A1G2P7N1_9BACT|nr:MAG: hypothetical protein A3G59_02570 [Candidatus Taylorbacteria bacterium RIFCSPLOWO2_12_FULL_47_20]
MKYKRDFRSLDEATQAEVRRLAFADLDRGDRIQRVADRYEVNYQTIKDWKHRRTELEKRDCFGQKRGRDEHEQKLIQPKKEEMIKTIIKNKTPDDINIEATLWDRRAIQALVKQKVGVTLNLQRVSVYAKRWGLSPQRPAKYASEQDQAKITEWLKKEYPLIRERAKAEGAEIHWEDETGIALSTYHARGYASKGNTPVISLPAKKARVSMISSITNRGDMQFMLYQKGLKAPTFITFMRRLITHRKRKIFLIVDNLRAHYAKKVEVWVTAHRDEIEIFFPASLCSAVQSR